VLDPDHKGADIVAFLSIKTIKEFSLPLRSKEIR
jgi:hypothetical protein